jgi:translation initiation factor 2A
VAKIYSKGASQFSLTDSLPSASGATGALSVTVAAFMPESSGKPATASLFRFSYNGADSLGAVVVDGPIATRTMFAATEANMHWSSTGKMLLIHTHCDVDKSNSSYYGNSGLFFMAADGSKEVFYVYLKMLEKR